VFPILRYGADPGALQMTVRFAGVILEHLLDLGFRAGLLVQEDLAGNGLHVGIRQLRRDGETVAELLETRRTSQGRLA